MDALEVIARRHSISRLDEPAPGEEDLGKIVDAALAAPDHGNLRPWRFIVLRGAAKEAFGTTLREAHEQRCNSAGLPIDETAAHKEQLKLERAPLVLVVAFVPVGSTRIPQTEQRDAVAAAVENALVAATALGYGSMWRTGKAARDPVVKSALGLGADDAIVGFLYLGTLSAATAPHGKASSIHPDRQTARDVVVEWVSDPLR